MLGLVDICLLHYVNRVHGESRYGGTEIGDNMELYPSSNCSAFDALPLWGRSG